MIKDKMQTITQILVLVLLLLASKGKLCWANLPTAAVMVAPAPVQGSEKYLLVEGLFEETQESESEPEHLSDEDDASDNKPPKSLGGSLINFVSFPYLFAPLLAFRIPSIFLIDYPLFQAYLYFRQLRN